MRAQRFRHRPSPPHPNTLISANILFKQAMTISKTFFLIFIALLFPHECEPWRRRRRRRAPPPCKPRDCTVTSWTGWGPCSHQCGSSGTQRRTRAITSYQTCGGRCPYHLSEVRACNRHCQNGGTPQNGYCSCRPGFTGTCCQQGELIDCFCI